MDDALRDLERATLAAPTDGALRARHLLALVRLGNLEEPWRLARERGHAELADQIFELAQAPFTLEVTRWPHPNRPDETCAHYLGYVAGERPRLTIGRRSDVELYLPSPWVNGRHCYVVHAEGSRFSLQDMESANGIFLGESRVVAGELEGRSRYSVSNPEIVIELRLGWDEERWPAPPGAHIDRFLARFGV